VGVDLFQTLLHNSSVETQPDFRRTAEFHFRRWKRFSDTFVWQRKGPKKWCDVKFMFGWFTSLMAQIFLGFGVRLGRVFLSTLLLIALTWAFNYWAWPALELDSQKLAAYKSVPMHFQALFFTIGNLSTFGTADFSPNSTFGLMAVACQVMFGLSWIGIATAMIVKRLVR
jgi:hypothetical protein